MCGPDFRTKAQICKLLFATINQRLVLISGRQHEQAPALAAERWQPRAGPAHEDNLVGRGGSKQLEEKLLWEVNLEERMVPTRGAPSPSKWASGRGGSGDQHQHLQSRGRKRHRREMLASLTGADKEEEEAPSPSTLPPLWHQALGTQGGGLQPSATSPPASGSQPLPGLLQKSPTCWLAGGVPSIKSSLVKPPSPWYLSL